MMDYERPTSSQVEAYKMEWQQLHPNGATPTQMALDNLTATFILSNFGRPGVLFDLAKWLKRDDYSVIEATRENHQYLASIATHLFIKNFTDIHALSQIVTLIRDLDVVFIAPDDLPYHGNFEGVHKLGHTDFMDLREKIKLYLQLLSKDLVFQARVKQTKKYDESVNILKSVLEFSPN